MFSLCKDRRTITQSCTLFGEHLIYTVYGLSGTQIGIIQLDKANLQTVKQKVLNLTRDNGMFLLKNSSHSFVVNIKK